MLYIDLMGPKQMESAIGKRYAFVCVGDFSKYTWVGFIREKSNTFDVLICVKLKNENDHNIGKIRSDHGKEFENANFVEFYDIYGVLHEFLALITPEQNRFVERKNRTLQEMAHVMLNSKKLTKFFGHNYLMLHVILLNMCTWVQALVLLY